MYEEVINSVWAGNVLSPYSALISKISLISPSKLPAFWYFSESEFMFLFESSPSCVLGSSDTGLDISCLLISDPLAICEFPES